MERNRLPDFLKHGDKALIVSPSGNIEIKYIDGGKVILEDWGLSVDIALHAANSYGRFCGTIEERLSDLQSAMNDTSVKLIFCSRGGYGVVHLLDKLDFTKINKNLKWLVGYSDITALHQIFLHNNIISLHAPMSRHLTEEGNDQSSKYLKNILFGKIPEYTIEPHPLNIEGKAEGTLFGGNLAVLCSLIGSNYLRTPENGILFIEDIGEAPYKIDRMMWTLKLAGILSNIKGLIVGNFSCYEEDPLMYTPVYESIKNMMSEYNIPVAFNFPVGHTNNNYPLLHGSCVELITDANHIILRQNI